MLFECDRLSTVLGAVSVAGKVFYTKPGQKATLECGVTAYTQSLGWHHNGELVISVGRDGMQRKGTDKCPLCNPIYSLKIIRCS